MSKKPGWVPHMEKFKGFGNERCPKCGWDSFSMSLQGSYGKPLPRGVVLDPNQEHYKIEHLFVNCDKCDHGYRALPLDAKG